MPKGHLQFTRYLKKNRRGLRKQFSMCESKNSHLGMNVFIFEDKSFIKGIHGRASKSFSSCINLSLLPLEDRSNMKGSSHKTIQFIFYLSSNFGHF